MNNKLLLVADHKFWLRYKGCLVRVDNLIRYLLESSVSLTVLYLGKLDNADAEIIQKRYPQINLFIPPVNLPNHLKPSQEVTSLSSTAKVVLKKVISPKIISRLRSIKNHSLLNLKGAVKKVIPRNILGILQTKTKQSVTFPSNREPCLQDFYRKDYQEYFDEVFRNLKPDFIIVEYIRLAYLVDHLSKSDRDHTRLLIDTNDVMHQRCQAFHQNQVQHWINISRAEESETLRKFDTVMAIQSKDAEQFKSMVPNQKVITVEHASKVRKFKAQNNSNVTLSYFASKAKPNQFAIIRFLEQVWPYLYEKTAHRAHLQIVGNICELLQINQLPEGVKLMGYVDDLEKLYQEADIIINPVFFGGGLKIKNVEALCYGKPLVTSSVGAEGLERATNQAFLVCDSPEEMLETLTNLVENFELRRSLSEQAYAFAKHNFNPEFAYRELASILFE